MAYGNNETEFEGGAPKKADVLIRSTQAIAVRQQELGEQIKLAVSRIEEAIDLISKNNQDSSYVIKQSGEIFSSLQDENAALKQELLYLAKQSENIYAGLADKISEVAATPRAEGAPDARLGEVAESVKKTAEAYAGLEERISELTVQNKRNEAVFDTVLSKLEELSSRLDSVAERSARTEREDDRPAPAMSYEVLDKINYIADQLKKNEGAHAMLADKFELLSMRVEQFGFASAKGTTVFTQPAVAPAPVQPLYSGQIDYDKLAEKIAALIPSREAVSPDYIASKVAEQIIVPEAAASNVKVSVDSYEIAKQVADIIGAENAVRYEAPAETAVPVAVSAGIDEEAVADRIAAKLGIADRVQAAAEVNIDEDALAEKIAAKLGEMHGETAAVSATVDIDEEELAEKLAAKLGAVKEEITNSTAESISFDEEELADRIALKVGSLRSEDFEILVDDEGCYSISKEIANRLDYSAISNVVADRLRDALDLAAANAPDYEDMAERISEKITVAGINEDAIADKAAAVLSNYLPEIDTDEITDKVTGAVIDVVSAIPQPNLDSESICNTITERLLESQEDHDYDIVIDDEGISKITELVFEGVKKDSEERFAKVEEELAKLSELVTNAVSDDYGEEEYEEDYDEQAAAEEDYSRISEIVAAEIEKGVASRFESVEENFNKLTDLLTAEEDEVTEDEQPEEVEEAEEVYEEDYSKLSEIVAAEIEKGVTARLDSVEAKLDELLTSEPENEQSEEVEEAEEVYEEDYSKLSEIVAAEIEKGIENGVTARLDSVEAKLDELLTSEPENEQSEEVEEVEEVYEEDYSKLSEIVAAEIEKGVASRFESVEENINKLTEMLTLEDENEQPEEVEEVEEVYEEDYSKLSEIVAAEIEKGVASRFESVEENINKLTEMLTLEDEDEQPEEVEEVEEVYEEDYSKLSEIVAAEIEKGIENGVTARLDSVEQNISKLTEMITDEDGVRPVADREDDVEEYEEVIEEDYTKLAEAVVGEMRRGMNARFDKVDENIAALTELVGNSANDGSRFEKVEEGIALISGFVAGSGGMNDRFDKLEQDIANISKVLEDGVEVTSDGEETLRPSFDYEKIEEDITQIKDMLASGVIAANIAADEAAAASAARSAEVVIEVPVEVPVEVTAETPVQPAPVAEQTATVAQPESVEVEPAPQIQPEEPAVQPVEVNPAEEFESYQTLETVEQSPVVEFIKPIEFEEFEEDEEEPDDDDDDFRLDVLDTDSFSDDELMPGEMSEYADGVDFANMMKFKRSFIARIIQSNDDYKQYYGEVKHALLSYKKVNSNVAWGAERFNKGRETIARMKIRGKTLCLYLALDPTAYKTSVYHHLDVSDNKSVAGTPMMVKIKSNLGVRKAIRLIDEMLFVRNGIKKEIPERDYAAMYPYETIEELIDDGLVKDVRKK